MSDVRNEILEYIKRRPGSHLREIVRALDLAIGQAQYHLDKLEREGKIVVYKIGRYKRYYPPQFTYEDAKIVGLMYLEGTRKVLEVLCSGDHSLRELAEATGMQPQTVAFHIKLLERYKVVKKESNGKYKLRNPRIKDIISLIQSTPVDRLLDRFLHFWTYGSS